MPRLALVERLQNADVPITSVVAPAGYGKSTLLAQWHDQSISKTSWLTLDRYDNDPAILVRYLAAALHRIDPIDSTILDWLLAPGAVELDSLARRLGTVVASAPSFFLMVIDQAEVVENPLCRDMIGELALNLPPGCRLALASRTEPPIPIVRLRARGQIDELSGDDLAMTPAEASRLVEAAGAPMDQEELGALMLRTEGWAAGLYLAARARASRTTAGPAGSSRVEERYVGDYVRSELLSMLSGGAARLLTETSMLDRLSGPLCDAVTGTTGSQRALESLAHSNMLILPLDGQGTWYRCHNLLREVLADELACQDPFVIVRLHDRAANVVRSERLHRAGARARPSGG